MFSASVRASFVGAIKKGDTMNCSETMTAMVVEYMERSGATKKDAAKALGISPSTLRTRLAGKTDWRISELKCAEVSGMFTVKEYSSRLGY